MRSTSLTTSSKNFPSAQRKSELLTSHVGKIWLLSHEGDVDLAAKLNEWERFYNFHRPHGGDNGKTPYEALGEKLQ